VVIHTWNIFIHFLDDLRFRGSRLFEGLEVNYISVKVNFENEEIGEPGV
jgi:hypothetical protein